MQNSNQLTKIQGKFSYLLEAIITKPRWVLVLVLGRFQVVRFIYSLLSKLCGNSQEALNPNSHSLFSNLDEKEVVKILKKDGIFVGIMLPQQILKNILQYVKYQDCFAGGRTDLGFKISEKDKVDLIYDLPFYVARYFNVSKSCLPVSKLAKDPKLQEIATNYIGRQAKYTGASLYWTFPVKGTSSDFCNQHFSQFHYDVDDYKSLRFCFYLSDVVTFESGPHVCIRGSHTKKNIFHTINFFSRIRSEEELIRFYGHEKFVTLTGESGFGFIEDTFCFHKGAIPESKPRLFLQLHFAANNYNLAEHHDYRDPWTLKSHIFSSSKNHERISI